jgi:uncharacterized repeat protein (TIGR01451 family)
MGALQDKRSHGDPLSMQGTGRRLAALALAAAISLAVGCNALRVPAFDPTGQHIFSGQSTQLTVPHLHEHVPTAAFPNVPAAPPCEGPHCGHGHHHGHGHQGLLGHHHRQGIHPAAQLRDSSYVVMMPGRVVAPVGSEVIVVAGICGETGHYVTRQPLEWMMSPDSVGHIMQVGNNRWHFFTDWLSARYAEKLDLDWARSRTHTHRQTVTRGTEALNDDVVLGRGQSWVSVMSPTEGASFVTVMAPNETNWDRRRQTATIYWVDAQWTLPPPIIARVDRREPALLTTTLARSQGVGPIEGWLIRYEAVDGPLALFENGQRAIEIPTDIHGNATAALVPQTNESGITQVSVQIIRPASRAGDVPRMVVGQGLTSVAWSAPGLSVRATGPATADADRPVTYRVEVSNTGDMPAPNVVLSYTLPEGTTLVGTNPPAQPFGNRLEWRLGDLPARSAAQAVEVTVAMRLQARFDHHFRATSVRAGGAELAADGVVSTNVSRSALVVRMRGPGTVPVGGQATFLAEIENVSSLPATNVNVSDSFDPGLQHISGQASPLLASLGTIAPGERRVLALNFIALQQGRHCHRLEVTADGGLSATVEDCVTATGEAPVARVGVRLMGPDQMAVGQRGKYDIEVRNLGTAPLTNVRIGLAYSASLRAVGASSNYELGRNEISWRLPELAAGDAIRWEFEAMAMRADPSARSVATVSADGGIVQSTDLVTQIAAPPGEPAPRPDPAPQPAPARGALRVEVLDTDDPVPVGQEFAYRITISNASDEPDQSIAVVIEKPAELDFGRLIGVPAGARVEATRIVLPSFAELRGRESLRPIELRVTAREAGEYQLRVRARSARVPDGVEATQSTRVLPE